MKKILSLILCILLAISCLGCIEPVNKKSPILMDSAMPDAPFKMHFIDVGQGDCILIETDGHYALIDAGEAADTHKGVGYLGDLGVTSLDLIIATHPHTDHCGGLAQIIRSFSCGYFIFPETDVETNTWYNVLDAADERGVPCEVAKAGDVYALGEATVTILSPKENSVYSQLNNYSLVCMVEYKDASVLLMGDAEMVVERELLAEGYDLSADVIKLGHHGSSSSSSEKFMEAVNPSMAVITCGKNNDYGHPHSETLYTLRAFHIPHLSTAEDGNILLSSDGEKISFTTDSGSESVYKSTEKVEDTSYVGNKNSHIFHRYFCDSVRQTKDRNKVYFTSRDEAIDQGYSPCKGCNP